MSQFSLPDILTLDNILHDWESVHSFVRSLDSSDRDYVLYPGNGYIDKDSDVVYVVQEATAHLEYLPGDEEKIQVTLVTEGTETWAIANVANIAGIRLDKQRNLHVFRIESWDGYHPKPVLVSSIPLPSSLGLSVNVFEYNESYIVCGGVSNTHEVPQSNTRIDWSNRSYLIVESQTGTVRVPVEEEGDVSAYLCVLDSDLVDMTLYDNNDNVLFRFSESPDVEKNVIIPRKDVTIPPSVLDILGL